MQRLGPTKKKKRKSCECVECFGHWTVFICWTESGLGIRDGGLRVDPQRSQTHSHPTNLFLSLNLWCKDLVPQKRGKVNAMSVLNVSATGLSLCAEQRVDFVQELWVTLELIHKGVSFTQQISSLVLICDAKTWSHKKKEKQWVCWLFQPLDCLYALNREWTLYKRWVTDQWELITLKGVSFTQQISSLVLICDAKTWSHKKEEKEKQWVCWMFWPLDCLYALNRE